MPPQHVVLISTSAASEDGLAAWAERTGRRTVTGPVRGRLRFAQMMLALGWQSKREITMTRTRIRTAMAAQTREQGRYLGGRPPYGTSG